MAVLELIAIFLPLPPKHWDERHELLCPVYTILLQQPEELRQWFVVCV